MNIELLISYVQIFNAIAMPIIVAGFGWYISHKLEQFRLSANRETSWREYRAAELLKQVNQFQKASDDIIFFLGVLGLKSKENGKVSPEENRKIRIEFQRLAFMEWKLKLMTNSNSGSGKEISESAKKIQTELTKSVEEKEVNFAVIFQLYAEMIEATNTAHKELLKLQ